MAVTSFSMQTTRDDQQSCSPFSPSLLCVFSQKHRLSKRGEERVGNVLTSLSAASLVGALCAILCKMCISLFQLKLISMTNTKGPGALNSLRISMWAVWEAET